MSHTKNEMQDGVFSKNRPESSAIDESNSGGSSSGGVALKKGPWTSAEDAILVAYVKKHGEGNWNAVQKHSGLSRCGKSCRLRWANHLRPNLKKGAFTKEEEQLIVELHAKMGNKWARMAAHLPGRTDNEIKNYWNTRIKRLQRAGLPLYPPGLCVQEFQESQPGQSRDGVDTGNERCHGILQTNNYDIPDVVFDSLKATDGALPYVSELPYVSSCCMLYNGLGYSEHLSFTPPAAHHQKRLREPTTLQYPDYGRSATDGFPSFGRSQEDFCESVQPYYLRSQLGPYAKKSIYYSAIQGSQPFSTGNSSASTPTSVAVKFELPSLQYPESNVCSWAESPFPPLLIDPIDTFIQSSPQTDTYEPYCLSPRNSGLLDTLLYEAKTLRSGKCNPPDKSSNSSTVTPCDMGDSSTLNVCQSGWKDHGDPISPLGHSATSLFNEFTPISATGSSLDEHLPAETFAGYNVKSEPATDWSTDQEIGTYTEFKLAQPAALLASYCPGESSGCIKEQDILSDDAAMLPAVGLSNHRKHSTANQGKGP